MKYYSATLAAFLFVLTLTAQAQQLSPKALNSKCYSTAGDSLTMSDVLQQASTDAILIDLWATWCKDCIVGFPKVKDLQTTYENITFLFLSVDKKPDEWVNGIERFKLSGTHYRLENGWKSDFCGEVELDWIPRYIIVNRFGKILHHKSILADDKQLIKSLDGLVSKK